MLADPAEACIARQRFFEHGPRVDEHAISERTDTLDHAVGEPLQGVAHELVIVAAERVTRYVGALWVGECGKGVGGLFGPVIHAHAYGTQGAGFQFRRTGATTAVPRHVVHVAVVARLEPAQQVLLVLREFYIGDADCRKTEFRREPVELLPQCLHVDGFDHAASILPTCLRPTGCTWPRRCVPAIDTR